MLLVALTGGIATGKSHVRARVASRGVPTIDADAVVHDLLKGGPVAAAVARSFGPSFLGADGAVDRRALGRLVFSDPAARADLEAIIHPRVYERISEWASEQAAAGAPWVVADIPLLFETGRQEAFHPIIVAACDAERQLRRVMDRDGLDEAAARARVGAQWPIGDKVARATFVVQTDGAFEETDRQVDEVCVLIDAEARGSLRRWVRP